MKNLSEVKLNGLEKAMITKAINSHATDGHPIADEATLPFFRIPFAIECLGKMTASSAYDLTTVVDLRNKLNRAIRGLS